MRDPSTVSAARDDRKNERAGKTRKTFRYGKNSARRTATLIVPVNLRP